MGGGLCVGEGVRTNDRVRYHPLRTYFGGIGGGDLGGGGTGLQPWPLCGPAALGSMRWRRTTCARPSLRDVEWHHSVVAASAARVCVLCFHVHGGCRSDGLRAPMSSPPTAAMASQTQWLWRSGPTRFCLWWDWARRFAAAAPTPSSPFSAHLPRARAVPLPWSLLSVHPCPSRLSSQPLSVRVAVAGMD